MTDEEKAVEDAPKAEDAPKPDATAPTVAANPTPHPVKKDVGGGCCDGILDVCRPPKQPAARLLYIGILLLIAPFCLKMLIFDMALTNSQSFLEPTRLSSEKSYEKQLIQSQVWHIDDAIRELTWDNNANRRAIDKLSREIAEIDSASEKPDGADQQIEAKKKAIEDKTKEMEKKNEEITKKREEKAKVLEEKVHPQQERLDLDYAPDLRDAELAQAGDTTDAIGWVQTGMGFFRLLLDLVKVAGIVAVLLGSMALLVDEKANGQLKVFALVASAVVLLACTVFAPLTILL